MSSGFMSPLFIGRNIYYGGNGRIQGSVSRIGSVPLLRRVRLFRDRDGVCVGETWSDSAGAYEFVWIDPAERYSVIAYDHEHNYRAVIADNLTPELMA